MCFIFSSEKSDEMEEKIALLIETNTGLQEQLTAVSANLISLPERMVAAMAGNSVSNTGNPSNKTPTGVPHPNNEIVNQQQPLQNG